VGNKLAAKEEEMRRNEGTHKPRSLRHHNSPSTEAGADGLGHHHQNITKVRGMKEPEDPSPWYEGTRGSRSSSPKLDNKFANSLPTGGICDQLNKNNPKILGIEIAKQGS
jgi:hypothetical protein